MHSYNTVHIGVPPLLATPGHGGHQGFQQHAILAHHSRARTSSTLLWGGVALLLLLGAFMAAAISRKLFSPWQSLPQVKINQSSLQAGVPTWPPQPLVTPAAATSQQPLDLVNPGGIAGGSGPLPRPSQLKKCSPVGEDPFHGNDRNKDESRPFVRFCCPGTVQKLGQWHNQWMINKLRCVKGPPMPNWGAIVQSAHVAPGRVRLMTFNTFYQNHEYEMLAGLIGQIGPDIAAIEEIPSWKRKDGLIDALQRIGHHYQWASPTGFMEFYDGHILYNTDKWQVLDADVFLVDQSARVPGIKRGVNWAVLERLADKSRVLVMGTHPSFDVRAHGGDWPAMDVVQRMPPLMKRLEAKWHAPSVFMCDCNTGDNSPSMQWLKRGGAGRKFVTAASHQIDHIYIESSPRPLGNPLSAHVVSPGNVGTRTREWAMADHAPVFVDVTLTPAS